MLAPLGYELADATHLDGRWLLRIALIWNEADDCAALIPIDLDALKPGVMRKYSSQDIPRGYPAEKTARFRIGLDRALSVLDQLDSDVVRMGWRDGPGNH